MEKVENKIDSILLPLLEKLVYMEKGQKFIKLDDSPCVYREDFK